MTGVTMLGNKVI